MLNDLMGPAPNDYFEKQCAFPILGQTRLQTAARKFARRATGAGTDCAARAAKTCVFKRAQEPPVPAPLDPVKLFDPRTPSLRSSPFPACCLGAPR